MGDECFDELTIEDLVVKVIAAAIDHFLGNFNWKKTKYKHYGDKIRHLTFIFQ